jgi:dCTP deaminase
MSILTGQEIKNQINIGHIRIGKFDENRVQPNSYDVTLGDKLSFYTLNEYFDSDNHYEPYLDSMQENKMITKKIPDSGYILMPQTLYIVETVESVWSDNYIVELSGTSSLARLGITIHKTAGYANIGHEFKWILEVEVTHPIKIYPGMKIGQMYFHTSEGENDIQYCGKYKDQQLGDKLCGSLNHLNKGGDM